MVHFPTAPPQEKCSITQFSLETMHYPCNAGQDRSSRETRILNRRTSSVKSELPNGVYGNEFSKPENPFKQYEERLYVIEVRCPSLRSCFRSETKNHCGGEMSHKLLVLPLYWPDILWHLYNSLGHLLLGLWSCWSLDLSCGLPRSPCNLL